MMRKLFPPLAVRPERMSRLVFPRYIPPLPRGITTGTGEGFTPDGKLTRGQFITLLLQAYSVEPDHNPADNFADAGDTYYTGFLAAAKRLSITDGVGGNRFAPENAITRQEMFKLLYRTLEVFGRLPDSGKTLADFSDSGRLPIGQKSPWGHW